VKKAACEYRGGFSRPVQFWSFSQRAFVKCPERMQRVQTFMLRVVPFLTAFIFCRLGYHVLEVLLLA